jgi:hypothetical protein
LKPVTAKIKRSRNRSLGRVIKHTCKSRQAYKAVDIKNSSIPGLPDRHAGPNDRFDEQG